MEENQNLNVEKYLKAIAVMTNSVGKLDVLKLHLKSMYNDTMSITILESVIHDLSKAVGMDYKSLDVETIPTMKQPIETPAPKVEPLKVVVTEDKIEDDIIEYGDVKYSKDCGFAKYMNMANKTLQEKFSKKTKKVKKVEENKNNGIEYDEATGNRTYKFTNSSTLSFMIYNEDKQELIMTFLRNGRTYMYNNIPMPIFQNLVQIDESKQFSVGSYFQQNVVKKEKLYPYKELTDTEFIGVV